MDTKGYETYCKVKKIFDLYHKYGEKDYIGEDINQNEHMLQAAQLAEEKNLGDEAILAALFHDIGHLISFENDELKTNQYGVKDHEKVGADYLKKNGFLNSIIPDLVEKHVKAKKYLAYKDPTYFDRLTYASKATLIEQGGLMNSHEAEFFEKDPLFTLAIAIRKIDEEAKVVDKETPTLDYYKELCYNYLLSKNKKNKKSEK